MRRCYLGSEGRRLSSLLQYGRPPAQSATVQSQALKFPIGNQYRFHLRGPYNRQTSLPQYQQQINKEKQGAVVPVLGTVLLGLK